MIKWEDRNDCGECNHLNPKGCDKWDINRGKGDKEPENWGSNPIQHSCFEKKPILGAI